MKNTVFDRRMDALTRLRASQYDNSKACRKGTQTREEWQQSKDAEISRLEEIVHGKRAFLKR